MTDIRRSGRARPANKKYINDPFAAIEKDVLYASSDSGSDTSSAPEDQGDDAEAEVPLDEENEEDDLLSEGAPSEGEDAGAEEERDLDDGEGLIAVDSENEAGPVGNSIHPRGAMKMNSSAQKRRERPVGMLSNPMRKRGFEEYHMKGGIERRVVQLFGPSKGDLGPLIQTRDQWVKQHALPSKTVDADGLGGLRKTFFCPEEVQERENKQTRLWYREQGGRQAFERGQYSREISATDAQAYLPESTQCSVLLGPYSQPKLCSLKTGSSISVADAFVAKKKRKSWLMNFGAKVADAQWVPGNEGKTQYLAVAIRQKNPSARNYKLFHNAKAPAFAAQKPFAASIQVWAFGCSPDGRVDIEKPPHLALVICTHWGSVKQIRWSPVGLSDIGVLDDNSNSIHLGLLAGVWSDGRTRILDISFPKSDAFAPKTHHINITKAAFEVLPQMTVSTCLTWLSGTTLAVGTAHGYVAVWTLTHANTFPPVDGPQNEPQGQPNHNPRPWFFRNLDTTYILTISSAYPSHPTYISTTGGDGHNRMTDLRCPALDTVGTPRYRVYSSAQAWSEQTQCFLTPDEAYLIRGHPLRRYYMNLGLLRAEAQVLTMATSPLHPAVLIGSADGVVLMGNPLPRLLNTKETPWQQIWFKHEWRRGKNAEMTSTAEATLPASETTEIAPPPHISIPTAEPSGPSTPAPTGPETPAQVQTASLPQTPTPGFNPTTPTPQGPKPSVPPHILSQPLSRITEGYKAYTTALNHMREGDGYADGGRLATVYEKATAVTCVAWNPNFRAGTWAVAGMANGLLRVEDIGI